MKNSQNKGHTKISESTVNDAYHCQLQDYYILVVGLFLSEWSSAELQGPVVQSIVSLTTSLRLQLVKYMQTIVSNMLLFFVGKM